MWKTYEEWMIGLLDDWVIGKKTGRKFFRPGKIKKHMTRR
jgi:hypothetical protein